MIFQILNNKCFYGFNLFSIILIIICINSIYELIIDRRPWSQKAIVIPSLICYIFTSVDLSFIGFMFYTNFGDIIHYSLKENLNLSYIINLLAIVSVVTGLYHSGYFCTDEAITLYRLGISPVQLRQRKRILNMLVIISFLSHIILYMFILFYA